MLPAKLTDENFLPNQSLLPGQVPYNGSLLLPQRLFQGRQKLSSQAASRMAGEEPDTVLWSLKSSGSFVAGDSGSDPRIMPQWLDKDKLLHAKQVRCLSPLLMQSP